MKKIRFEKFGNSVILEVQNEKKNKELQFQESIMNLIKLLLSAEKVP